MRLTEPAKHTRSILFIKKSYWVVRDVVETSGDHVLQARFHLDPRMALLHPEDNTVRVVSANDNAPVLKMSAFAKNFEWGKENASVSECYGEKKEASVLTINVLAKGSEELVVFLLPDGATVREIEGPAFEIEIGGRRDVLKFDGENQPQYVRY
jgi:hypothetical protein